MSLLTRELKIPIGGLKYEAGSDMIEETYTPSAQNVHTQNEEIRTKPGVSYFNTQDDELKLFLYYDAGYDSLQKLREHTDKTKLAQSITTAAGRTIDKVKLYLKRAGTITAGRKIWVTIYTDNAGVPGTAVTGSISNYIEASTMSTSVGWIEFTLGTVITLATATKYWIVLQGDYDVSEDNNIQWGFDSTSSAYTDGDAFVNKPEWSTLGAGMDFLFKVYRDTTTVMLSDSFDMTTGTSYLMVATLDRLFYWDTNTLAWIDISGYLAANLFTGTVDDTFEYDVYPASDSFMITNYTNYIKVWTGTGFCATLANAPRAKHMKVYKDHLVLGWVYEDAADRPQRARWNDAGDLTNWTTGTAGYHDFLEVNDFINGLFLINDYLAITKERSVALGYPVANDYVFQFDLKLKELGPVNGRWVMARGNYMLFVGWEDIYLFDGTNYEPVGDEMIKQEFFASTDPHYLQRGFSIDMEEVGEWHIFVPSNGSEYCDRVWVFNYKKKTWWKYTLSEYVRSAGWYLSSIGFNIDSLIGTIDQQLWRIGDRTISGFNYLNMLGTVDGRVAYIDYNIGEEFSNAVDAYIDTKDFSFVNELGKRIQGKINSIVIRASGTKANLYYSTDLGESFQVVPGGELTLTQGMRSHKIEFRKNAENIRFRIRKDGIGESFRLRNFSFEVQPGGRIITAE